MSTKYFDAMKANGFSYETTASVRKMFTCPNCGFQFSLVYARTFACQGCSEAALGCPKVRCARCDHEFFIKESPIVKTDEYQRHLGDHITRIINDRNEGLGITTLNR